MDPIQNSIASARQRIDQLNRINLLVFVVSFVSFVLNIPQNMTEVFFWETYFKDKRFITFVSYINTARMFSMLMLALKPYIIGIVSKKIRKEFWLALTCAEEDSALRRRGIEINPAKLRQKEAETVFRGVVNGQYHDSSSDEHDSEKTVDFTKPGHQDDDHQVASSTTDQLGP